MTKYFSDLAKFNFYLLDSQKKPKRFAVTGKNVLNLDFKIDIL